MTIGELIKELETALESVKGQQIGTDNSISEVTRKAVSTLEIEYPLSVGNCRVSVSTLDFGEVDIIYFMPHYKADKRKLNGEGNRIEKISVNLTRDIQPNFDIVNLSQKLSYDIAKENKERLENEIAELENEIEEKKVAIHELEKIMETERYD